MPSVDVELVIPVHNERLVLATNVSRVHAFLTGRAGFTWSIVVAENASSDGTPAIADELATRLPALRVVHLPEPGRGRALREAWLASEATVVAYMDVDLSTDLESFPRLVDPILVGQADIAIGSRLVPGATTVRGPKREFISRAYNAVLHTTLRTGFADAQCGFKAVRAETARELLPYVVDDGWFFDTELLVLAERLGLRVQEVPVTWVDDPDSRVRILPTARADLYGVVRMLRKRPWRDVVLNRPSSTERIAR
jgi:glycosyltransferase involved in cell wall biosynthesis